MEKIAAPPIKCQGIKTKLVPWITSMIPSDLSGHWIEPFMGSGVVAFNLKPKNAILCDLNPHLINFYNALKEGIITADLVRVFLKKEGDQLRQKGQEYYYQVRSRFNQCHEPLDFLFLNRACFNGMIRFNGQGEFNVPFCRKPERFTPAYITKIVNQVSVTQKLLNQGNYTFKCQGFEQTIREGGKEDIMYCDPPYLGRHADYYNGWNILQENELNQQLLHAKSKFILSTWHSNDYRKNEYLKTVWKSFNIRTKAHFYHVGGYQTNRNPMLEALVTNFDESSNPLS